MPERRIERHKTIDSTMRRAAELARENAPSGTIVSAEEQTAGLGRLGRNWHSPAGTNLYFTAILRLDVPPQQMPVVTLALGLAIADTVEILGGVLPDLKWPNDVLVSGKKIAGILTHLENGAVLAGVGLNVNEVSFPAELESVATSLRIETRREHPIEPLLQFAAASMDTYSKILVTSGLRPILSQFSARSSFVDGRRVEVEGIRGTTSGLDAGGFLRMRRDDGEEVTIHAGGVRPLD
jgi:BirA family biotin operon repressor/biotin-[acetyl-CoA-carboxylase] ligase